MRTLIYCLSLLVLLLAVPDPAIAQETKGKISIVPVADLHKAANGGWTAHGINNVGIGERVVMKALAFYNAETGLPLGDYHDVIVNVLSATWTFTSVPTASALVSANIVDTTTAGTSKKIVYFNPDVAGVYEVSMTAVTDSGTATATAKITAAKYVGVGVFNRTKQKIDNPKCAPCHTDVIASYEKTNHASAMQRKMDTDGGHYADYCVRCHSVGHNAGANGGIDDYMTALGWSVPPNHTGVWDSLYAAALIASAGGNDSLVTMMGLMNIQCENCHGPAGNHAVQGAIAGDPGFANPDYMYKTFDSGVCAPCHGAPDRHPRYIQWQASMHSESHIRGTYGFYQNRGSCSRCHVGQGFVNETIKGKTPPANGYSDPSTIGCATCHDPHSKDGEYQLRRGSAREACTGCHTTRLSSRGLHASHQGQMVQGITSTAATLDFVNNPGVADVSGFELPGYKYENSAHSDIEQRCVVCHMAPSPSFDPTYGTKDTLSTKLGGHTFAIHWDGDDPADESKHMINNTGCKSCHDGLSFGPVSLDMVHTSQNTIKALLDTLKAYLPPRSGTNPEPKAPADMTTPVYVAGSYNYYFVLNDLSYGVHNPKYARALLESSIEQVKLGAGAAEIASVKDVPDDQGHRVQVVWNRFPAESFSFNPVKTYGVWREDAQIGTKVTPKKNYTEMFQSGVVGQQYSVSGFVWTFVASVPASNFATYSYVAETLKDSSAAGSAMTNFKVVGYAVNNAAVYSSQPFAGYSVNNGTTTNVEQTEGLPTAYALGQNYPNPFNPSTTITFSLPEAGTVVLQVYTISGELVKTITQGTFPAGNFKAIWNATDQNGAQVATGMYLYRIQTGSFSSVKKMILMK